MSNIKQCRVLGIFFILFLMFCYTVSSTENADTTGINICAIIKDMDAEIHIAPEPKSEKETDAEEIRVAVMPIIFRRSTHGRQFESDLGKKKMDILACLARQYITNLIHEAGFSTISSQELDNAIKEVAPEYWLEDNRTPEKLKQLAEKAGAARIIFFDMGPATEISLSAAGGSQMTTWGNMEVYDDNGNLTHFLSHRGNWIIRGAGEDIFRQLLCIAVTISWAKFLGTDIKGISPNEMARAGSEGMLAAMTSPGAAFIQNEIGNDKLFYYEAASRQDLIKKLLFSWTGKKIWEVENMSLVFDPENMQPSFHPLYPPEETACKPIPVTGKSTIGILITNPWHRSKKCTNVSELSQLDKKFERYHRQFEKAQDEYNAKMIKEIEQLAKKKKMQVYIGQGETIWRSGGLQDISDTMLAEKGKQMGCNVVVLIETETFGYKNYQTFVKIIDLNSREIRKTSFIKKSTEQSAQSVLNMFIFND
ncbi:MAG TPA: hypothetical protein PKM17_13020 [Syntrophorhabdus sp.]|nr:hypothetical protein [Syntrophorhabdus sp.]